MSDRLRPSLLAPLVDLGKWLAAIPARGVIVGGVAASLLGRPRFTQDIDALAIISEVDWERAIALARDYGIVPRTGDTLEFARRARVMLLKHAESAIDIDVILGGLSFEHNAVEHAETHHVGDVLVMLPRVEDLLIMKAVAHRPQDMQDIDGLLDNHPEVDVESVRRWVREFAVASAMSDLLDDFDKAVARRAVRQSRR
jgi:hypothetical protein